MIVKKYSEFESNGLIILTEDEKKYLWSKIEHNKKKKAIELKNGLYEILTSVGESELSEDEMISILNSLEYSVKKQLKNPDVKFKNINAESLKSKLPTSWVGVLYSSLPAKSKRDSKDSE